MDNISDPPADGVDTKENADPTKGNDPPVDTPPADKQITPPEDNVEAIAKRVVEYIKEEEAQHLTMGGSKQISNVDTAYGRR